MKIYNQETETAPKQKQFHLLTKTCQRRTRIWQTKPKVGIIWKIDHAQC